VPLANLGTRSANVTISCISSLQIKFN
jgi:hypothetical protein